MHARNITLFSLRAILALILLVNGLNKFFHFFDKVYTSHKAVAFMEGLAESAYFFNFLGAYEIIIAIMLLITPLVPLALLLLLPFSINAFLFHLFVAPESIQMAAALLVLNIYISISYFNYIKLLIIKKK
jgi:putative oxidoreductase